MVENGPHFPHLIEHNLHATWQRCRRDDFRATEDTASLLLRVFSCTPSAAVPTTKVSKFWSRKDTTTTKTKKGVDDIYDDDAKCDQTPFPIRRNDIDISQTRLLRNASLLRVRELETGRSRARAGVPETNRGEIRGDDDGGDFGRDVSQPEGCGRCVPFLLRSFSRLDETPRRRCRWYIFLRVVVVLLFVVRVTKN